MCLKCIAKALMGIKDEPVGKAGDQALKQMRETKFELDRRQKLIIAEIQEAVDGINSKYEASNKIIAERHNAAWDLVKTQLGIDPDANCEINIVTG